MGFFLLVVLLVATASARAQLVTPFVQSFQNPIAIAFRSGHLYAANTLSDSISDVSPGGDWVGLFSTQVHSPQGLAFDQAGNMYIANGSDGTIDKITPAKVVTTFSHGFKRPQALIYHKGQLYVADQIAGSVDVIGSNGTPHIFASGFSMPSALAFDASDNLYVADAFTGTVSKITPTKTVSIFDSALYEPLGLAFDSTGNLYVSELERSEITIITPTGQASIFMPGGNLQPQGLVIVGTTMYVASLGNKIYTVNLVGTPTPTLYAPPLSSPSSLAQDSAGDVFVLNSATNTISEIPDGKPETETIAKGFSKAAAIAADPNGDLFVADSSAGTVTKVTPNGSSSVIATNVPSAQSLAIDASNNLYVAGTTGISTDGEISKISRAGKTTVISVLSNQLPACLTISPTGKVFAFLTSSSTQPNISTIAPDGSTTIFANLGYSYTTEASCGGMEFDSVGNLYVSGYVFESDSCCTGIFKISTAGQSSFLTGTSGSGILVNTGVNGTYLTIANTTQNSVSYIYPNAPPNASYSMTKADYEDAYISEGSYGEVSPAGTCGGTTTGSGTRTWQSPNVMAEYEDCLSTSLGLLPQQIPQYFRSDLGLDSNGVLPPSGYGIINTNYPYADFFVASLYYASYIEFATESGNYSPPPPPTAAEQSAVSPDGSAISLDLTVGSTGNPFQATVLGTPVGGTVSGTPGTAVTYRPKASFTGIGSFTFVLTNYLGATAEARAFIAVNTAPPAAPVITTLSATTGPDAGGQTVVISGSNLSGPAAVLFGTNPAAIQSEAANSITLTVPAGTSGSVPVTVTTAGGTSATTAATTFTYQ